MNRDECDDLDVETMSSDALDITECTLTAVLRTMVVAGALLGCALALFVLGAVVDDGRVFVAGAAGFVMALCVFETARYIVRAMPVEGLR